MLWLSLYLPHLPLEVFAATDTPLVISQGPDNRLQVCARNRSAATAGIELEMALGAAEVLAPQLQVCPRNPRAEQALLERLAGWAGQFSSSVVLRPPQGVLLEIGASLRLFRGLANLRRGVEEGLNELGYRARLGIAPTPLGAWLLARHGGGSACDRRELSAHLFTLPLTLLELPTKKLATLHGLGLYTLGDCQRLPRAGLARRLGRALVKQLDRAFGQRPDPQQIYQPPQQFDARLILPAPVEESEALAFAARRLLLELCGYLRGCDRGVSELRFLLHHHNAPDTSLKLGLVAPSRDAEHLLGLLRERLDRHTLTAPVEELTLTAERLTPWQIERTDLFDSPAENSGDWATLLERLQARLGPKALSGLDLHADHRPERAWRRCPPGEPGKQHTIAAPRPNWLLGTPVRLSQNQSLSHCFALQQGPERIESGWWDGERVRRDYYVARHSSGVRYWVYRDLLVEGSWFLHGIFA
jgi:protein ImuB